MADDDFNNKVEEQHEMNVDDAELLQQQADKKKKVWRSVIVLG